MLARMGIVKICSLLSFCSSCNDPRHNILVDPLLSVICATQLLVVQAVSSLLEPQYFVTPVRAYVTYLLL